LRNKTNLRTPAATANERKEPPDGRESKAEGKYTSEASELHEIAEGINARSGGAVSVTSS